MLSYFLFAAAVLAVEPGQAPQPSAAPKKLLIANADGCVDGRSLKMARPAGIDDVELIVEPIYRLTGSDQIKGEIKALNRRPARVRGQLSKLPGAGPPSTMIGDARGGHWHRARRLDGADRHACAGAARARGDQHHGARRRLRRQPRTGEG